VLTAVLLGGVSFEGGRGSFLGVLTGLLFLGVLYDGLIVLGVSPFWADAFTGLALALAAALDVIYRNIRLTAPPDADLTDADLTDEPALEVARSSAEHR
jgi:ribose transport system permease protein